MNTVHKTYEKKLGTYTQKWSRYFFLPEWISLCATGLVKVHEDKLVCIPSETRLPFLVQIYNSNSLGNKIGIILYFGFLHIYFVLKWREVKWSEVKWVTVKFLWTKAPCTVGWPYSEGTGLYCDYFMWFVCILCCGCFNWFCYVWVFW